MSQMSFDVVVVGGGAAGVAAAVSAARAGSRVALVERYGFLGGAGTNASVSTLDGYFDQTGAQVVRGIGNDVLTRLVAGGWAGIHRMQSSGNTLVPFDREALKRVLDELTDEVGVTVLLHSLVVAAATDGERVTSVTVAHRGGQVTLTAPAFVDASGDGALLLAAGAGVEITPLSQRQKSTLVAIVGGLDEDAAVDKKSMAQAVTTYRETDPDVPDMVAGFALYNRFTGDTMLFVADERVDALDVLQLSAAERHGRATIARVLDAFRAELPGWKGARLIGTGPQIGLREVCRLVGRATATADDALSGARFPDAIGRAGWPIEDHSKDVPRYLPIKDGGYFHLRYGTVASRTHDNVWAAGRLLASTPEAFCSIRVMGTSFATGHAAGAAAALAVAGHPHDVHRVCALLRSQDALI